MAFFKNIFSKSLAYNELCSALLKGNTPISLSGVSDIHKAHIAAALCEQNRVSLLLCRNEVLGRQFCSDINALLGRNSAVFFPERDLCFDILQTLVKFVQHYVGQQRTDNSALRNTGLRKANTSNFGFQHRGQDT